MTSEILSLITLDKIHLPALIVVFQAFGLLFAAPSLPLPEYKFCESKDLVSLVYPFLSLVGSKTPQTATCGLGQKKKISPLNIKWG